MSHRVPTLSLLAAATLSPFCATSVEAASLNLLEVSNELSFEFERPGPPLPGDSQSTSASITSGFEPDSQGRLATPADLRPNTIGTGEIVAGEPILSLSAAPLIVEADRGAASFDLDLFLTTTADAFAGVDIAATRTAASVRFTVDAEYEAAVFGQLFAFEPAGITNEAAFSLTGSDGTVLLDLDTEDGDSLDRTLPDDSPFALGRLTPGVEYLFAVSDEYSISASLEEDEAITLVTGGGATLLLDPVDPVDRPTDPDGPGVDPTPIPTPAAATAGLALLGGVLGRRRR